MSQFVYPPVSVNTGDLAKEVTLLQVETNTADTVTELQTANTSLNNIETSTASIVTSTSNTVTELQSANSSLANIDTATDSTVTQLVTANSTLTSLDGKNFATEATLNDVLSEVTEINNISNVAVQDQLDDILLDTSVTNIPASSSSPLEIVASLTVGQFCRKIEVVEDIGEFMGLYSGGIGSEVLVAVLPLGGGSCHVGLLSAGDRISIRAMENTAISTGKIAINFLG